MTYPYNGTVQYDYQHVQFDTSDPSKLTTSVLTKTASGPNITSGIWTYSFAPGSELVPDENGDLDLADVTTITLPNGIGTKKYIHQGDTVTGFENVWAAGLLLSTETRNQDATLAEQTIHYWGKRKISDESYSRGVPNQSDMVSNAPIQTEIQTWRSGGTHKTMMSLHDVYGNPQRIEETAGVTTIPNKITNITYYNDPVKWIIGKKEDETITGIGTIDRQFNILGQLVSEDKYGVETTYTYTSDGDLAIITDARFNTITKSNYKRGIARLENHPESVTILRTVNNSGTVASTTNGRGITTSFIYDGLNRLTDIDYPNLLSSDVTIAWSSTDKTLTRGNYEEIVTFDGFGQETQVDRTDKISSETITKTTTYDVLGRKIFDSYPNSAIGVTFTYDAIDRLTQVDHPDGESRSYVYGTTGDNVHVFETNERGHQTTYTFRAYGHPDNGKVLLYKISPESICTLIDYNLLNQVTQIYQGEINATDGLCYGNARTYTYDVNYFLKDENNPETGITLYGRDPVGNMKSSQVGTSAITNYTYDNLNRLKLTNYPDNTGNDAPDINYVYDENDNLKQLTKGNTDWVYTYDENDNLTDETLTVTGANAQVFGLTYGYDALDTLSTITYPDSFVVNYAPDNLGRPTQVGSFASNVIYHPNGNVKSYDLANGQTTTIDLTPTRLFTDRIQVGNGSNIVDLDYSYDEIGNVKSIIDSANIYNNINFLDYDGVDRLIQADADTWGAGIISYNYRGDIVSKSIGNTTLTYINGLRLLQVNDPVTSLKNNYGYDVYGNTTLDTFLLANTPLSQHQYTYDDASNLMNATGGLPTGEITFDKSYIYDGNRQRTVETDNTTGITNHSVYSKFGQLSYERNVAECRFTNYIRLGSSLIARRDDSFQITDTDIDGLNLCEELQQGTDPNNPDTDGDGLTDGNEVNVHTTNPLLTDTDGDGLTDGNEVNVYTTNPLLTDTDGDGLTDGNEVNVHTTNPLLTDTDGDGLTDGNEVNVHTTNPLLADTDGDGMDDGFEINFGLDPLSNDALLDLDNDGLTNLQEFLLGTEPNNVDTDNDRLFDGFEVSNGLDPLDPSDVATLSDSDNDGIPDLVEIDLGLDPNNAVDAYTDLDGDGFTNLQEFLTTHQIDDPNSSPVPGELAWSYDLGSSGGFAIASDNTIYVGSQNLLAFSPDGQIKWTFSAATGHPVIGLDHTVYATSVDGNLYAVRPDGTELWKVDIGTGSTPSKPAIATDGTIYVQSDYSLYSINPVDGSINWKFIDTPHLSRYLVVGQGGNIYMSTVGALYAIDPAGNELWSINANGINKMAIGADGTLYVPIWGVSGAATLQAINPTDGTIIWEYIYGPFGVSPSASAAIDVDGTIYIGSPSGFGPAATTKKIFAINQNGTLKQTYNTPSSVNSTPAIAADGTIIIGVNGNSAVGEFWSINPGDGSLKWSYTARHVSINSSPVIGRDGTVYIGDNFGRLHALVDNSGGLRTTAPWPMRGHDLYQRSNPMDLGTIPTVSISTPADGLSVPQGTIINFTGSADDVEDGDLSASIQWNSSKEGSPIGTGTSFSTSTLIGGIHTITASVSDSFGKRRSYYNYCYRHSRG